MYTFIITALIIVSIGLIIVVLLQSGKSAGLSGAISGGAEQLFGKQKARGLDLDFASINRCFIDSFLHINDRSFILWRVT